MGDSRIAPGGIGESLPRRASHRKGERLTTPYTLWMVQRAREAWLGLAQAERSAVERALDRTGCEALLACAPRHRVVRRPFRLFLARDA